MRVGTTVANLASLWKIMFQFSICMMWDSMVYINFNGDLFKFDMYIGMGVAINDF